MYQKECVVKVFALLMYPGAQEENSEPVTGMPKEAERCRQAQLLTTDSLAETSAGQLHRQDLWQQV